MCTKFTNAKIDSKLQILKYSMNFFLFNGCNLVPFGSIQNMTVYIDQNLDDTVQHPRYLLCKSKYDCLY